MQGTPVRREEARIEIILSGLKVIDVIS